MTCGVSDDRVRAFMSGKSDELVDHVSTCDTCQRRLEESLDEQPDDITTQTMRAVRLESTTKQLLATIVEVGVRYGEAVATYTVRNDR